MPPSPSLTQFFKCWDYRYMPLCLSSILDDKSCNACIYKLIFSLKRILILFYFSSNLQLCLWFCLVSSQMLHNQCLFLIILWPLLCLCLGYPLCNFIHVWLLHLHWCPSLTSYEPSCLSQLPTLLSTEHVMRALRIWAYDHLDSYCQLLFILQVSTCLVYTLRLQTTLSSL